MSNIGEAIEWARDCRNMSQQELADKAGVGRSYISHVECGDMKPSEEWLSKICEALEIDREDLV